MYWLLKTEPTCWSWADQVRDDVTSWDGVRNFAAQKHMRAMHVGDQAFFYHTGDEKCIVGTVEIVRTVYPDPSDSKGKFQMVDVKTRTPFAQAVSLKRIKEDPRCGHLPLVTQGRLSVMPIDQACWQLILSWGGVH